MLQFHILVFRVFVSQVADELVAEFVDPNSNLVSPDKVVHSSALG